MELSGFYAQLDEENVVIQVITGVPADELIEGKPAAEWYSDFTGVLCVPTYANLEGVTYAGIGYTYDPDTDTFTPPPTLEPLDDTVA